MRRAGWSSASLNNNCYCCNLNNVPNLRQIYPDRPLCFTTNNVTPTTNSAVRLVDFVASKVGVIGYFPYFVLSNTDWALDRKRHVFYARLTEQCELRGEWNGCDSLLVYAAVW